MGGLWVKEAKVNISGALKSNEKLERIYEYGWDLSITLLTNPVKLRSISIPGILSSFPCLSPRSNL